MEKKPSKSSSSPSSFLERLFQRIEYRFSRKGPPAKANIEHQHVFGPHGCWCGAKSPVDVRRIAKVPSVSSSDPFLTFEGVHSEEVAMKESLKGALQQRQNTVYAAGTSDSLRAQFRTFLSELIRLLATRYTSPLPVNDEEHCEAIRQISNIASLKFGKHLKGGRLRYGTSQKAFNLYLKYLWRLGKTLLPPPHCPVDGIVLQEAKIRGSWTRSDSEIEYRSWISQIRETARPRTLADWENDVWLRRVRGF